VEPHHLAITAVENGIQTAQDTLCYAIFEQYVVLTTTCIENRNGNRRRGTLDGADEGVEDVQSILERLLIISFSWVYKRCLQNLEI
jgi:hypothetical protein